MSDLLLSFKLFSQAFPDGPIVQQPVSQLPCVRVIAKEHEGIKSYEH